MTPLLKHAFIKAKRALKYMRALSKLGLLFYFGTNVNSVALNETPQSKTALCADKNSIRNELKILMPLNRMDSQ